MIKTLTLTDPNLWETWLVKDAPLETFIIFPWTRVDLHFYFCHKDLSLNWKQEISSKNRLKGHNFCPRLGVSQYFSWCCTSTNFIFMCAGGNHFRFCFSLTSPGLYVFPEWREVIYRSWFIRTRTTVSDDPKQTASSCVCVAIQGLAVFSAGLQLDQAAGV